MQVFCLKFLPVLHSQEATTTCNQLDGSNSPAGSYQAMGQQQYQKCIQPHPSLWESAVQLGWPATQYSKIINREPGEAEPPGPPHPWAQQLWFGSAECLMVLRYSGNTYRKRERQPGDGGGVQKVFGPEE